MGAVIPKTHLLEPVSSLTLTLSSPEKKLQVLGLCEFKRAFLEWCLFRNAASSNNIFSDALSPPRLKGDIGWKCQQLDALVNKSDFHCKEK